MIVVVDSSVAIKWFLAEPDHADAVALSKAAKQMYAPELLIAEVANVAWKEAIRKNITAEQARAIAAQIGRAPIKFVPIADLHERAIEVALELNHSVYDCLYLAWAELLGAYLITADRKFLNKTKTSKHVNFIKLLGNEPDILLSIPLHISRNKIEEIIKAADLFRATHRNVVDRLTEGRPLRIFSSVDAQVAFRSPSYRRLEQIYASLSQDEKIDLLALGWFGKDLGQPNWVGLRKHAHLSLGDESPSNIQYNLSQAIHLRKALDKLDGKG